MSEFALALLIVGGIAAITGIAACLRSALALRAGAQRILDHTFVRTAESTARAMSRAGVAGARLDAAHRVFAHAAAGLHEAAASAAGYAERVTVIAISVDMALVLVVPQLRGIAASSGGADASHRPDRT